LRRAPLKENQGGKAMNGGKLYAGNLSYSVTNEELKELFSQYGEVKQANVIEGKGFGFVEMSSPEEAEAARKALNGTDFKGRALRIEEAKPQKPKQDRGYGKY
jgi:RNA recognition motif-containing protein